MTTSINLEELAYNNIGLNKPQTFVKQVKEFAKDPKIFKSFVEHHHFNSDSRKFYYTSINIPKALYADQEFIKTYSEKILSFVSNITNSKYININKRFVESLQVSWKLFDAETKKKLSAKIRKKLGSAYVYVKKEALNLIIESVENEDEAKELTNYISVMNSDQINKLITSFPNLLNDKVISKQINKSAFAKNQYEKVDLNQDDESRRKLIRLIIEKPTLLKKVDKAIDITIDDLKSLPSGMRFQLLKSIYESRFKRLSYINNLIDKGKYEVAVSYVAGIYSYDVWMRYVQINQIPDDEMKNLLFSVSLNKNEEASEWYENYKLYLDIKNRLNPHIELLLKY